MKLGLLFMVVGFAVGLVAYTAGMITHNRVFFGVGAGGNIIQLVGIAVATLIKD